MNLRSKFKLLFLLIFCLFVGNKLQATHVMGSDLNYRCIEPGLYEITLTVYRDCNGIQSSYSPILVQDGTKTITLNSATKVSTRDITGLDRCNVNSRCNGGPFPYGIEEHVYKTTVDLRSDTSCNWTISWNNCCRNNNISTGSRDQNFYTEVKLNKCLTKCNSTPVFTTPPVAIICHNQDFVFNNGALDTFDFGDSLSYELTNGLDGPTSSITYSGQFSPVRPLTFWGFPNQNLAFPAGFHLDPVTGDLRFRPILVNQIAVIVMKVKEWRKDSLGNWQQIGELRRDMQVIIVNCGQLGGGGANVSPVLPTINPVNVCSGDSVCVRIVATDANANDTVRLSWNGGLPGGSFHVVNPGKLRDTAYVCWKPKESDTSSVPYTFVVTALDNSCPLVGRAVKSYSFQVYLSPETSMEYSVDTCGLVQMKSFPKSNNYRNPVFSWLLRNDDGDTVYLNSSPNQNAYTFIVPGTYSVYHRITIESGLCYREFFDTFTMAPYPVVRTSIPGDTSVCQYSPISLNAIGTGGVLPHTYVWSTSPSETTTSINPIIESDTQFIVTIYDKIGCFHRDTTNVISVELPKAKIGVDKKAHCYTGNLFSFVDSSSMQEHAFTRLWHFGDADTSSQEKPFKSYNTAGEYSITMYVTSDFGCLDTAHETIRVHPQSVPNFTINDSAQCLRDNAFEMDASLSNNPVDAIDFYYWSFGDNTYDTGMVVQKSYSTHQEKSLRLITETEFGCRDTLQKTALVFPQSNLKMQFSDTAMCLNGNTINANAVGSAIETGFIQEYRWRWGDGNEDTGKYSPTHYYTYSDSFVVQLLGVSDAGCRDSISKQIAIHPKVEGQFSADTTSLCLRQNSFNFSTNTLQLLHGSILSITWEFGDGFGDGMSNTSHQYNRADTFEVSLFTFTNFACRDTFTRNIIVYPQAELDFVSNADSQCSNINRFTLNASSSQIEWGSLDSFYWNFGNGVADTGSFIDSLVYSGIGTYTVRLNTVSNYGCRDTLVQPRVVHPSPVANILVQDDHQCFRDNLFSFVDNSQIGFTSLSRVWYFGDGDSSNNASLNKSYTTADTFLVRLVSISQFNCRDTSEMPVWVHPQSIPNFSIDDSIQCFRGHDYNFDASLSNNPYEGITNYFWDFGDASTSSGITANKQYASFGTKSVRLITRTESNCLDTLIKPIRINPQTQNRISLNDSQHCFKGNLLQANGNSSTINDGFIAVFRWDWGDGTQDTGRFAPAKQYQTNDTFYINLLTISDKSCRDSSFQRIVIHPQTIPDFAIDTPHLCLKNNLFSFDAGASSIPYGNIVAYEWHYGDAITGSGINSNHRYATSNTFDVSVFTTSAMGCRDTLTKSLTVMPQSNLAIQTNADTQCLNVNNYYFSSSLSQIAWGSIDSFYWNIPSAGFYDGTTVNGISFPDSGSYVVTLYSTSDFGCKDTFHKELLVYPRANPVIDANHPDLCLRGNEFIYNALNSTVPTGTLDSFYWHISDGADYKGLQTPGHHYLIHDTFQVRLVTLSNGICYDTVFANSVVHPHPVTVLNSNYLDHCLSGNSFDFNAASTSIPSGFIQEYHWDFNDASLDTGAMIIGKSYSTHGSYDLVVTAVSQLGCADTLIQNIVVHPQGIPVINVQDSFVCVEGNFFDLDGAASSIPYGSFDQFEWFFNDGSYFNNPIVNLKNFNNYDTFGVKLRTTTDKGCLDSTTRLFVVYPNPTAQFVINDSIQCFDQRQNFDFDATPSSVPSPWGGIQSYNWYSNDGVSHHGLNWNNKTFSSRGVYSVKLVVMSADGCLDSIAHEVHFYPAMSPRFTTPDTAQCFNEHEFVFNALGSTIPIGTIADYQWRYSDLSSSNGSISPPKQFSHYDTFGVWLITTSNEDCKDSVYKEVIVFESPAINFSVDEVCLKQGSEFRNLSTSNRDSIVRWLWEFGDGKESDTIAPIHFYNRVGKFNVKLTGVTSNGCPAEIALDSVAWVKELPQSDFSYDKIDYDFEKVTFSFQDLSRQAIEWNWYMGDGTSSSEQNPIHEYSDTGHYLVGLDVLNDLGCRDTVERIVWALPNYEIHVPNSFTPNGDRLNETFAPLGTIYYKDYSMTIINRWGEIMFQTNDMKKGWDGTNNGVECPMDSYGVYISVTDLDGVRHTKRDVLHLVR